MTSDVRDGFPAISRRRLVQTGAATAGATLAAGLGRRPTGVRAQGDASPVAGDNPFGEATTEGGTYVLAYAGKGRPRMFVPTSYFGTDAFFVCKLLYTPLLRLDSNWQNLGPGVATDWEWSTDQTQLTVRLRDDIVFHDGQPLTAADVVFTYKLMVRADRFPAVQDISIFQGGDDYQTGATEEFAGVEAIDDYTVRFNLASPSSVFLLNISNCGILPAHGFDEAALAVGAVIEELPFFTFASGPPIGSGPWKVDEYDPETNLTLAAHEQYYKGTPNLDGIVFRLGVTGPAKISGIESGDFDAVFVQAVFQEAVTLRENADLEIVTNYAMANEWTVGVATEKPELTPDVRAALLAAIDRDLLYETLTFGYAQPAPSVMMYPPLFPNPELPEYPYDPERARELLQGSNWDPDRVLQFGSLALANPGTPETMAAIINMWGEIGVKAEIFPMDPATPFEYWDANPHEYDLTFDSFAWLAYDPSSAYRNFSCERQPNPSSYCNAEFDEAMQAGIASGDEATAIGHYQRAQVILQTDLPALPVWIEPEIWAINKRMHGGVLGRGPLNDIQSELWWKEG